MIWLCHNIIMTIFESLVIVVIVINTPKKSLEHIKPINATNVYF